MFRKQVSVSDTVTCGHLLEHSASSSGFALVIIRNLRGSALRPWHSARPLLRAPLGAQIGGLLHA